MDASLFWQGLALGFAIAAPVGPIGVLCIRRTLAEGRRAGVASGLGAATADAFYGSIAALGLTVVSGFLIAQQSTLRLIGGLFLLYLGVRTFIAAPALTPAQGDSSTVARAYASTFFLTLTNPMTILAFAAIFAGLGLAEGAGDAGAAAFLIAGVFAGSALWWLCLSGGVSLLRTRITPTGLRWVNRVSGAIIVTFGVVALTSFLRL